jgi:hypothetical protein
MQVQNPPPLPKSSSQVQDYDPTSTQHRGNENYTFSSEPRPVQKDGKKLFRDTVGHGNEEDGDIRGAYVLYF